MQNSFSKKDVPVEEKIDFKSDPKAFIPMTDVSAAGRAEIKKARSKAALSTGINLFLAVGKGVVGVIGSSSALLGDAVHSATDVIASAVTCFGFWLAGKEHSSFPHGLYKAETFRSLIPKFEIT